VVTVVKRIRSGCFGDGMKEVQDSAIGKRPNELFDGGGCLGLQSKDVPGKPASAGYLTKIACRAAGRFSKQVVRGDSQHIADPHEAGEAGGRVAPLQAPVPLGGQPEAFGRLSLGPPKRLSDSAKAFPDPLRDPSRLGFVLESFRHVLNPIVPTDWTAPALTSE